MCLHFFHGVLHTTFTLIAETAQNVNSVWRRFLVFQKAIVPFLQQVFMPIVTTIFRALTTTIDERDQVAQTERRLLQRGYFTFISTLVNNNVAEVLSSQSQYEQGDHSSGKVWEWLNGR